MQLYFIVLIWLIKWTQYLSTFLLASIAFLEMQLSAASAYAN